MAIDPVTYLQRNGNRFTPHHMSFLGKLEENFVGVNMIFWNDPEGKLIYGEIGGEMRPGYFVMFRKEEDIILIIKCYVTCI